MSDASTRKQFRRLVKLISQDVKRVSPTPAEFVPFATKAFVLLAILLMAYITAAVMVR